MTSSRSVHHPLSAHPESNTTSDNTQRQTQESHQAKPIVRHMDFSLDDNLPRYMFKNNPMISGLIYALSESFPRGEEMFIASVRAHQHKITDPELKQDVRAFIGQEAHHGKQHRLLNTLVSQRGFPNAFYDRLVRFLLAASKRLHGKRQLALTVGFEHVTATFGAEFLRKNHLICDQTDERINQLLVWHAIEEIEHKTVAFDVYQKTLKSNALRYRTFVLGVFFFLTYLTVATTHYTIKEGQLFNFKAWREFFSFLYGKELGMMTQLFRDMKAYFRPDYDPRDDDHSELLEQWLPYVDQALIKSH